MIGSIRHLCLRVTHIRHLTTSSVKCLPYTPNDNPGVYRRVKAISKDEPDIENAEIDYESMDQLEQDFFNAGMYEEVTREMKKISNRQQYKITERKHFKPPQEPSMLTWSEKEQMRYLHQENPEKWTPEALARSFPASPYIIKKLLKSRWRPLNAERLKLHDQKVSENWVAFHKGKLEVHDNQLRYHLAKFTDRKDGVRRITGEEAAKVTEVILPKPKRTDFLSLVTSFNSEKSQSMSDVKLLEERLEVKKQPLDGSRLDVINKSGAEYTLQQLRERLKHELDSFQETPDNMKVMMESKKLDVPENNKSSSSYVAPSESFKVNAVVRKKSMKSPLELFDPDNLPNKINIPKELWKEGKVYRVNDCFYNDRGHFLYRVPGLNPR